MERQMRVGLAVVLGLGWVMSSGRAAAAPAVAPAVQERAFDVADRHVDEAKKVVRFEVDRGVQRARYETYEFDLADYRAVVGKDDDGDKHGQLTLAFTVVSKSESANAPAAGQPAPEGGIRVTVLRCKLVARR